MPRIKAPTTIGNVPQRSQQIQEIVKCGSDASYFISNYVRISHPVRGPINFKTYSFQDKCLKAFQSNRFTIVNKSRQLGLSTMSAAYSLWMSLFQREKNILIIATKLTTAQLFITKVKGMYDSLPKWLVMPQIVTRSKSELTFSNGSKIKATPTSLASGRGEALSLLIFDEAAHIENIEELWLAIRPAITLGGSCIMISTPSGVGTLFHKIWIGAVKGEDGEGKPLPGNGTNEFYRVELPWTVHPEHDQEWYEKEAAEIRPARGERGVLQELCCCFGTAGDSFLPMDAMERLDLGIKTPIAYYGPHGGVWIWKYAEEGHRYAIALDLARGDAADFSTIQVIDTNTNEFVCEYQGKVPPEEVGYLAMDLGTKYNKALICPELNSFGLLAAKVLKDSRYPNLYYEKFTKNVYSSYLDSDVQDELPGFTTGAKNREEIIAKLETCIRSNRIRIYSSRLVDELKTFVWKTNKRAESMKGYNDDLIFAASLCNSLYEAAGVNVWDSADMTTSLISGMSVGIRKMNSIGTMWGQENKYMPPILTSANLKDHTQLTDAQVKHEASKQGPQNFRAAWWKQWDWLLKN